MSSGFRAHFLFCKLWLLRTQWQSKKSGIQYQLSALPLGGYVKMLDEREGNVAEQDLPYAFNRQSPWKRIAIVAAGPLINLIFAVLLFCAKNN